MAERQHVSSLVGTSVEARAGLLKFGGSKPYDCSATHGDHWRGPLCGKPARWYIGLEDTHAGMTVEGCFHPATVYTNVCDQHLAELRDEPRRVFLVERRTGSVNQSNVTVIDTRGFDGGAS